ASSGERLGERLPRHQDALAALADLDRLAIVEHRAQQRLLAHGTIVTALAGHAQPVGRRLRADEALAMRAKPAGAGGVERHGGAAIGTVHRSGILPESGCAGVAELADASDLKSEDPTRIVRVRFSPPALSTLALSSGCEHLKADDETSRSTQIVV